MTNIKLSVNAPLKQIKTLEELGYNCIEPSNTDIMKMQPAEFEAYAKELDGSRISCMVIDNPIPCSVSFSSKEWDIDDWDEYLTLSAIRAKRLHAKYWCFGNGSSRFLPENPDEAQWTMIHFYGAVRRCCDIGAKYGIDVIVEPLGPSVTNYLMTVEDTVVFLNELDRPNAYTMIDYRWEQEQGRPISETEKYADRIVHAHIDNPGTDYKGQKIRKPQSRSDGFDYGEFMEFIKSDLFHGVVSIEANCYNDYGEDLREALEVYKAYGILPENA